MGLGEGVAFPAIHSTIARSVPPEHQSTAVGVVTAASYAGTALAFGLAPLIIEDLGWPVRAAAVEGRAGGRGVCAALRMRIRSRRRCACLAP